VPPQRVAHRLRLPYPCAPSTEPTIRKLLAEAPRPFSVLNPGTPFSPSHEGAWEIACLPEVPPSGFGYPLGGVSPKDPRGCLSTLSRSWDFPFRAFLLSGDLGSRFREPFPSCTSCEDLLSLRRVLQGLTPARKAVSLLAPRTINPGRNRLLSWGSGPPRFSPRSTEAKSISLSTFPSRPSPEPAFPQASARTSGYRGTNAAAFPPERGADLPGLSHRRLRPTS
jgi:hypothetical protein